MELKQVIPIQFSMDSTPTESLSQIKWLLMHINEIVVVCYIAVDSKSKSYINQ